MVYSPSPEYPVACRSVAEIPPSGATGMNGGLASAQFRFETPQLAAGSFITVPETSSFGASLREPKRDEFLGV